MNLQQLFNRLFAEYGPQGWWPVTRENSYPEYLGGPITDNERFEVMVGAILTQNTTWKNVEKALINLNEKNLINSNKIRDIDTDKLADIIKPSGYFNQKAKKLQRLANFVLNNPNIKSLGTLELRKQLLAINGVGPETADSISLYAFNKPTPIVDTYTKRIFSRFGLVEGSYAKVKKFQEESFPKVSFQLQELHALLVEHAKQYCTKNNPDCWMCPVCNDCNKNY